MSFQPSKRSEIEPFHVMSVLAAAAQRADSHGDVLSLCAGQPSTPAPAPVLAAAHRALDDRVLGYTETSGIRPLREAIALHHRRTDGVAVTADDVIVTTGSSGGFTALFLAAFDPGDVVVMSRPGYPAYRNALSALGCRVQEIDCGPDTRYQPTVAMLEQVAAQLGSPPAGLIVASPANPTGTIIDPVELADLDRWCSAHNCLLISDEIYHGISYGRSCTSAWRTSGNSVVMGSVSKYFSMTGWRLGWMLVPGNLREPLDRILGNLTICPPTNAQYAAISAFSDESRVELDKHVQRYARNRDLVLERLSAMGISDIAPPDGAFYIYVDLGDRITDSVSWCADILRRTGVAVTPGVDFDTRNGKNTVRLSFAGATAEISEALDRLEPFLRGRTGG